MIAAISNRVKSDFPAPRASATPRLPGIMKPAIALLVCLFLSSCATDVEDGRAGRLARATGFWKPHLRYLSSSSPYSRLHVEVDAVEGSIPDQEHLDALRDFLVSHGGPFRGVTVELDDRIPESVAVHRKARSLALEYIDGPPDESTAFLYAIYYDSKRTADKKSNPHLTLIPYPSSIFIDLRYGKSMPDEFRKIAIMHEAGHALGLTRNTAHGDGLHCSNENCLMNAKLSFHISRFLSFRDPWKQRTLCDKCLADLASAREERHEEGLSQIGPYFVRSEKGYHVLSLPGFAYVQVGELSEIDWKHVESMRRETIAKLADETTIMMHSNEMDLDVAEKILPRLRADPYEAVGDLADNLDKKLEPYR